MQIINTSFFVDNSLNDSFLSWLRDNYIPVLRTNQHLISLRFSRVISPQEAASTTYSLQTEFTHPDFYEYWSVANAQMLDELRCVFQENVLAFSSILEEVTSVSGLLC